MKSKEAIDLEKQLAARAALRWVKSGMRLGLGSGSTSECFARHIAAALRNGTLRDIVAVPTSEKVAALAVELKIPLIELDENSRLDLTVDGADEIGPGLELIKGGGGALLREKVVASASNRNLIIADSSKMVAQLGKFPLPLEVVPFALRFVKSQVAALGGRAHVRTNRETGEAVRTDQGLLLLDCHFGDASKPRIEDARELQGFLQSIPGVAAHGLFLDTTSVAVIADGQEIVVHTHLGILHPDQLELEALPGPRFFRAATPL